MNIELLPKDKCLNFMEFNITGDNDNYNKCDEESMYLNSDVFNLFTNSFEKSNQLYEYFGETRYNSKNIIRLKNELENSLKKLKKLKSLDEFEKYIDTIFLGNSLVHNIEKKDDNWKKCWTEYLNQIIQVNTDLIRLIERCLDEDRILWVVGF